MKLLLLTVALLLSFTAIADQRFETHTGLCHFAYDAADDDNEVYFANCINEIDTHDYQDGAGRLAYGASITHADYNITDWVLKFGGKDQFLKGADANVSQYPDGVYVSAVNTPCVMVTSNYDAANDDDNQTVYITNDWNLDITYNDADKPKKNRPVVSVRYHLSCRGGVAQ